MGTRFLPEFSSVKFINLTTNTHLRRGMFHLKRSNRDLNVPFPGDFHCVTCNRVLLPKSAVYFTTDESRSFLQHPGTTDLAVWALPALETSSENEPAEEQMFEGAGATFRVQKQPKHNDKKGFVYPMTCECGERVGKACYDEATSDRVQEEVGNKVYFMCTILPSFPEY